MSLTRLNKFIAESGISSRRKADELIQQGRVVINKTVVLDLGHKVDPDKDEVLVDGERIRPRNFVYYLLNKPSGFVSTTSDEKSRPTVTDLVRTKEKVFPVGRLDYNTTGVLLLTNDGNFSNLLTHPKNQIPRVYEVHLDRYLEDDDKSSLLRGVYIEGEKGIFNKVEFPKIKDRKKVVVTCTEGRNRFVKKMFSALGYTVIALNRLSFAGIFADIPQGKSRRLLQSEVNNLINKYAK